jgi:hypothetical protein
MCRCIESGHSTIYCSIQEALLTRLSDNVPNGLRQSVPYRQEIASFRLASIQLSTATSDKSRCGGLALISPRLLSVIQVQPPNARIDWARIQRIEPSILADETQANSRSGRMSCSGAPQ